MIAKFGPPIPEGHLELGQAPERLLNGCIREPANFCHALCVLVADFVR